VTLIVTSFTAVLSFAKSIKGQGLVLGRIVIHIKGFAFSVGIEDADLAHALFYFDTLGWLCLLTTE
jgi:hypothetical protein